MTIIEEILIARSTMQYLVVHHLTQYNLTYNITVLVVNSPLFACKPFTVQ